MDVTPTRSAALEMKEDRRAMHDGYVFLDEKCLLLAGEILRELAAYARWRSELERRHATALRNLAAALGRHGLEGLLVHPAATLEGACTRRVARRLMGVRLQEAAWSAVTSPAPAAIDASPEAEACRQAFAAVLAALPPLAAVAGNLERLHLEYRRSVRRARALQDVLLPEVDRDLGEVESRLEELEQEEAISLRRGRDDAHPTT